MTTWSVAVAKKADRTA